MDHYFEKIFFCDFDGTITKRDTLDFLLEEHADERWLIYEEEWKQGIIGSRTCLEKQIECIDKFSMKNFEDFIEKIEIDESFITFYHEVLERKLPFYIISDGFNLIIERVFKKYHLPKPIIFSNQLTIQEDKLVPSFPRSNPGLCLVQSGMCKCSVIENEKKEIIYIGDGKSDLCASRLAKTLFAKGNLQKLCNDVNRAFLPFTNFAEIHKYYFN
jgi:2,3-diketo-5-methylthio-1-phosphopentane phosphatase